MSFMFRDRKETEFDYGSNESFHHNHKSYIRTYGPLHLKAIDGHELSEEEVLNWLRFSLDVTHYIKAWYKNGEGYFVKLHDSDSFVKLEWGFV